LQAFNPTVVLFKALAHLVFTCINEPCKVISEPFVLLVAHVWERVMDNADDGWGERARMKRGAIGLTSWWIL